MKRFYLMFVSGICLSYGHAQSVAPEVTANAGDHFATPSAQLSWTLGEPVIETHSTPVNQLTQGFHQTQLIITQLNDPLEDLQVKAFPNPTSESLTLQFSGQAEKVELRFMDMKGQVLLEQENSDPEEIQFDVSQYAQGQYLIQVATTSAYSQTFKIQIIR